MNDYTLEDMKQGRSPSSLIKKAPQSNPAGDRDNIYQKLKRRGDLYMKGARRTPDENYEYEQLNRAIKELEEVVPEFNELDKTGKPKGLPTHYYSGSGINDEAVDAIWGIMEKYQNLDLQESLMKGGSEGPQAKKSRKLKQDIASSFGEKTEVESSSGLRLLLNNVEFDKLMNLDKPLEKRKPGLHYDAALDVHKVGGQGMKDYRNKNNSSYINSVQSFLEKDNNHFFINESVGFMDGGGQEKPGGLNHSHFDVQPGAKAKGWIATRHNKYDSFGNPKPGQTEVSSLGANTRSYLENVNQTDIPLILYSISKNKSLLPKIEKVLKRKDFSRRRPTFKNKLETAILAMKQTKRDFREMESIYSEDIDSLRAKELSPTAKNIEGVSMQGDREIAAQMKALNDAINNI